MKKTKVIAYKFIYFLNKEQRQGCHSIVVIYRLRYILICVAANIQNSNRRRRRRRKEEAEEERSKLAQNSESAQQQLKVCYTNVEANAVTKNKREEHRKYNSE